MWITRFYSFLYLRIWLQKIIISQFFSYTFMHLFYKQNSEQLYSIINKTRVRYSYIRVSTACSFPIDYFPYYYLFEINRIYLFCVVYLIPVFIVTNLLEFLLANIRVASSCISSLFVNIAIQISEIFRMACIF